MDVYNGLSTRVNPEAAMSFVQPVAEKEDAPALEKEDSRTWLKLSTRMALDGPTGRFDLDVDLEIAKGEFLALSGPSGAGKTTLLRLIAGLARPNAGRIVVGGETWCDVGNRRHIPTRERSIGFVFQDYALFPNMTVKRNVEFALGRRRHAGETKELLELVGLENLQDAFPARLSGGQKQRLALIRALARRPAILLLDEPLSALDPPMRRQLQDELKRMHREFGTTTLLVSHDFSEILRLSDRAIRLDTGRIVFDGRPEELFGAARQNARLQIAAEYVDGPDRDGNVRARMDGHVHAIRCANMPPDVRPGDTILVEFHSADIRRPPVSPA
jgi:molybdate transport system ATP-binding protein